MRCLLGLIGLEEKAGEVVVAFGVVGLESEGVAIGGDGVVQFALGGEDLAEVGVVGGDGGAEGDGLADEVFGGGVLIGLVGEDAEHVEGVGVAGVGCKNLAVKAFGFRELAGFVEAEGAGEGGI